MPYQRRKFNYRRRRPAYRKPNYGRRSKFSKSARRSQGLSRNVFWFKHTGSIQANTGDAGRAFYAFGANDATIFNGFRNFARCFEQYKVLKVSIKFFPANIGSEDAPPLIPPQTFHRGNVCTWIDQPPLTNAQPAGINTVLSMPSAKLHPCRSVFKRWMKRPSGARTNTWTMINHDAQGSPIPQIDAWLSQIRFLGDNFGMINNIPYYFVEEYVQVIFRSRYTN